MSRIRSRNTGIEKTVFSYLRKRNIYFQRHYSLVAGKPDIAIPSKKIAVFIHGDFWHGYRFHVWRLRLPKKYWRNKIALNILRDKKHLRILRRQGWKILRVWGHEINEKEDVTLKKIANFLSSSK